MRTAWVILLAAAWAAAGDEIPLPTRKSTILRHGTEISIQKDVHIVGRGAGAVLEVEGSLKIHGVTGREVIVQDLWIEPAPRFDEIRLDKVFYRGSGGVRTPATPPRGKLVVENTNFEAGATLDVTFSGGELNMLNSSFREAVRIRGVPPEGKKATTFKSSILGCFAKLGGQSGFVGGIHMTGVTKVVFRNNRIRYPCSFVDCVPLTFDGNKVNADTLKFEHTRPGGFKGFKIQKSDIYASQIILVAAEAGKREIVVFDKCWFKGMERARGKDIEQRLIRATNAKIVFRKINSRPLELAGMVDR